MHRATGEPLDGLRLRYYVPTALGAADSVTGVIATGLDALPAWQFLGSRLAAEACASRALAA